ncbi:MAG: 50S ribosomal protein L9 [Eubacteriales bacterium]|jgi:large subunit ribosomal protein L9|nr:50S ribosomal protein L9 [Eubacteriales bacterium]
MIVILNRDVKGTGKAGEVVKVSDGYARNLLIPKGYATEATDGNIRSLEKQKKLQAEKRAEEKAAAEAIADKLKDIKVTIVTKSGEGGRLFGSITSKDISEALKKQENIDIDKKKIVLNNPIKQMGTFTVDIKLFYEVIGKLTVVVTD